MKRALVLVVASVMVGVLSVGVALATPGTGATASIVARATFDAVSASQTAGRDAVIQNVTIASGGYTGWHSHLGPTFVLVKAGTFTVYHGPEHGNPHAAHQCEGTDVAAGQGWIEMGGDVHLGQNNGSTTLELTVVYVDVPAGAAPRQDEAAPACAAAAGLTTGSAGSGITAAPVLSRGNFAAGGSITGAAGDDVVVQTTTWVPGGHSGWHSHPGSVVAIVKSGEDTLYSADCKAHKFGAGQGFMEEGGHLILARNEGTVPLVVYAAFFNVPVGGAFRNDEPEPATCKGLAAVAAPVASAPNTAALAEPASSSPLPAVPFLLAALAACLFAIRLSRTRRRG